jgi:hypothetical protein
VKRATPGQSRKAVRLARIFGLDRNPLRRASDRVEAWIRVGLVALFVTLGPLAAVAAGHWAYHAQVAAINAQAANTHAVKAVLLEPTTTSGDMALARLGGQVWARAQWERAGAPPQTGEVPVPAGLPTGSAVTVWLSTSGQVTGPPDRGGFVDAIVFAAMMALAIVGIMLAGALRVTQVFLNRRRLDAWEKAWSATEPRWTGRR